MKKLLSLLFLIFLAESLSATHIVGGEMYYHYLGNNQYKLTLIVYRDCFLGEAPFDSVASIGVFDGQGNVIDVLHVPVDDSALVPNAINTPCLQAPEDICYQVAEYFATVTLPPLPGGYILAYQRCCRNYSCINILDHFTGATYTAVIPDQQYAADDNPVYNQLPPTFICLGAPFTFNHSAFDVNGDSLVYSLYTPYGGADEINPQPDTPSSPPFTPINFQPPYSLSNVMGGVPLTIDPHTGILTATPSEVGQFVYGVLVQEYRNGVLIGETRRDFQVNVTACPNYTVASIFSPTLVCGSLTATFQNNSYGAATYSWNFGDPNSSNDTSTQVDPSYTYPDTGRYTLMLIAYAADPDCNDTAFGEARIYPAFTSKFGFIHPPCSNNFQFLDSSYGQVSPPNYWLWNFGDNHFSGVQSPAYQYAVPGNYTVTLVASSDSGCTDTATAFVEVKAVPVSSFTLQLDTCAHEVQFQNNSQGNETNQWIFGDNTTGTELNPIHNYMVDGNVTIYLIVSHDSVCVDTSQISINLPQVPIGEFSWVATPCDSLVHFQNLSINTPNVTWAFGDNTSAVNYNPVHMYTHSGAYTVTMNALGSNLTCTDQVTKVIYVNRQPLADFILDLDTCLLQTSATNYSTNATHYSWNYSDGHVDNSLNTTHPFDHDGIVSVQLIAMNDSGCSDTALTTALIPPLPRSDFSWHHDDCDSLVTFVEQSANSVAYRWFFGDGETLDDAQAEHIYHIAGDIPVELVSTSTHGCRDTSAKNIHIVIQTPAEFSFFLDSCSGQAYFSNQSPIAVYYDWNFGDESASTQENPVHVFHDNFTDYIVTLTVNKGTSCQEDIQKVFKNEINEGEIVYMPNSFTPNGDGLNDLFQPLLLKPCDVYSITILNRWGQVVYRNGDAATASWDGTFSGHLVEEDVYVYVLQGDRYKKTGHVLVIR